ncbi:hypothetical protein L596_019560 [Steinernema carpocapsae]|uniref:Sulfotransferase domain-containing protein n=1 Tax=Steinernema carpocapsae TaxID=34508 RepID=A0A4U5MQW1_STECR|nr:hypothetical protein L596_019560 [Steinernema carpocapsae]
MESHSHVTTFPFLLGSAKQLQPDVNDVFIATYPKCGTTWAEHIRCQLMIENYKPRAGKELSVYAPMIEWAGREVLAKC